MFLFVSGDGFIYAIMGIYMIGHLKGNILHKDARYVVLDVGGVGYKVGLTAERVRVLKEGSEASFWIHTVVREDALDLYGFEDRETLAFFELLITISGIGPKSALGIMNAAPLSSLKEAVISGETAYLTKISGIGKKIADKIVLELKGKVFDDGEVGVDTGRGARDGDVDALEALKALGYTHKEAREALENLPADISASKNSAEKVKAALRTLGK